MKPIQDAVTADARSKPVAVRGPHAERTASMRQRLVDAAILCLCRVGYAATTTQLVTQEAGVSRGAMLHHFPTKLDLVIAVGEHAAAMQNRHVRRRLNDFTPGMERFLALTHATWEAIGQPPALALIEIMVASRSDPGLAERFPPVIEALEARQLADVWEMAREIGIRDRDAIERMVRLHRAAMRGLVLERVFTRDGAAAEQSMAMLEWYKRQLTGLLLTNVNLAEANTVGSP